MKVVHTYFPVSYELDSLVIDSLEKRSGTYTWGPNRVFIENTTLFVKKHIYVTQKRNILEEK